MAMLDPRLLDLFETLNAARLDWLVFELMEGIRLGRPEIETEEQLAEARRIIATNDPPKVRAEPQVATAEAKPIEGDEQVEWAARYVTERMETALTQLEQAASSLDAIIADTPDPNLDGKAAAPYARMEVVLSDGELPQFSRREDIAEARIFVPKLRASLEAWSNQVRGQAQS